MPYKGALSGAVSKVITLEEIANEGSNKIQDAEGGF